MSRLPDLLRSRIVPAILTATGVSLIAGGLLTYTGAAEVPSPEPTQTIVTLSPRPSIALPTLPALTARPSPTPAPTIPADRVATRVVMPSLGIDLPIVKQPDPAYPACNVAMYHEAFGQPGSGRVTYLYAHARKGMFLSILNASKINNGASMLGAIVEVYTSDDQLYTYLVTEVRRHVKDLSPALAVTTEEVWLQTSEGPKVPAGQVGPKTQVIAQFLSTGPADHAAAHPKARPVNCK